MPTIGFDYAWTKPAVTALKAAGATFVCRYLSYDSSKNISAGELAELHSAGIAVVLNWETTATRAEGGYEAGASDAMAALAQANALALPADRPIYFSVDEDTTVGPLITGYFQGVASVLGVERTGAYGSYLVINGLLDAGLIRWAWQTYAWSRGLWDVRAHIRQVQNGVPVGGADCDVNNAMTSDYGQWLGEGDDELTPDDWTRLESLVKQAVSDGVKAELTLLQGVRTTPTGSPSTQPVTLAALADAAYIGYHGIPGDATHPGLTDVASGVTEAASRIANIQTGAVDPAAIRAALTGLKVEGTISQ